MSHLLVAAAATARRIFISLRSLRPKYFKVVSRGAFPPQPVGQSLARSQFPAEVEIVKKTADTCRKPTGIPELAVFNIR